MTKVQVNRVRQFCKENGLPRPDVLGEREPYGLRWFRSYDTAYSDYIAAMTFLVSLMKERDIKSHK